MPPPLRWVPKRKLTSSPAAMLRPRAADVALARPAGRDQLGVVGACGVADRHGGAEAHGQVPEPAALPGRRRDLRGELLLRERLGAQRPEARERAGLLGGLRAQDRLGAGPSVAEADRHDPPVGRVEPADPVRVLHVPARPAARSGTRPPGRSCGPSARRPAHGRRRSRRRARASRRAASARGRPSTAPARRGRRVARGRRWPACGRSWCWNSRPPSSSSTQWLRERSRA